MPEVGTAVFRAVAKFDDLIGESRRASRSLDDLKDSTEETNREFDQGSEKSSTLGERVGEMGRKVKQAGTDADSGGRGFGRLAVGISASGDSTTFLAGAMGMIRWPAIIAVLSELASAAIYAASALVALASALSPLAGLLAVGASAMTTFAQVMATITLGFSQVKDGFKAVAAAWKDGKLTADELTKATENMSPAAARFTRTLAELYPHFMRIRDAAAAGLLPGVERAMRALTPLTPILASGLQSMGRALGDAAEQGAKMVASGPWRRDIQSLMQSNVQVIRTLTPGILGVANGLRHIIMAAQPLTQWLARLASAAGVAFGRWAEGARTSGQLARFFEQTREVLSDVIRIVVNLGSALGSVFRAGYDTGRRLLDSIVQLTAKFREWAKSVEGQRTLTEWFERGERAVRALAGLLGDVISMFGRVAQKMTEIRGAGSFEGLVTQVRTQLLPAFEKFLLALHGGVLPGLITLATRVLDLASTFSNHTGTVTSFLTVLNGFLGVVRFLINDLGPFSSLLKGLLGIVFVLTGTWKALQLVMKLTGINAAIGLFRKLGGGAKAADAATAGMKGTMGSVPTTSTTAASGLQRFVAAVGRGAAAVGRFALSVVQGFGRAALAVGRFAVQAVAAMLRVVAQMAVLAARTVATAATVIARWVAMAAQAVASAAIKAGAWLLAHGAAVVTALAAFAVGVATTIGGWVAMAAAAVVNAVIIAAQWLIAFWPVALVIAIVAGLVFLIVKYWDEIKTAIGAGWDWVKEKTSAVWNAIKGFLGGLWDGIKSVAGSVWTWIKDKVGAVWTWIKDKTSAVWNGIRDFFSNAWAKIKEIVGQGVEAVKGFIGKLADIGADFVRGIWNGISRMGGWLWDQVTGFIRRNIIDPAKNLLGIGSPSKVAAAQARDVVRGWAEGLSDATPILNAVGGLTSKILSAVPSLTADVNVRNAARHAQGAVSFAFDFTGATFAPGGEDAVRAAVTDDEVVRQLIQAARGGRRP